MNIPTTLSWPSSSGGGGGGGGSISISISSSSSSSSMSSLQNRKKEEFCVTTHVLGTCSVAVG